MSGGPKGPNQRTSARTCAIRIGAILLWLPLAFGSLTKAGGPVLARPLPEAFTLVLDNWEARIIPESLSIVGRLKAPSNQREGKEVVIAESPGRIFRVESLKTAPNSARWKIPEL